MIKITFEGTTFEEVRHEILTTLREWVDLAEGKELTTRDHEPVTESAPEPAPDQTEDIAPLEAPEPPKKKKEYTLVDLSNAGATFMKAEESNTLKLMHLLQSFGVPSLVDLPAEQYQAFAEGLKALGADL